MTHGELLYQSSAFRSGFKECIMSGKFFIEQTDNGYAVRRLVQNEQVMSSQHKGRL
jgi:hypothetical protein